MPRLSIPAEMPEEVLTIICVIGNHARSEILRRLAGEALTAVELAAQMGVHHSSIHRHLVTLEEHGLVTADTEPGHRTGRGRTVRWRTISERVSELGQAWIAYASDETKD